MKFSQILSKPDTNYLKLVDGLNKISKAYKNFNQQFVKNFDLKRKIDEQLVEQKKFSKILNIGEKEFQTLFNKINFNFYPKEVDEECGTDDLRRIKEIESAYIEKSVRENKPSRVSKKFVHLISEVIYHDDFIEQLLIEINANRSESESENDDASSSYEIN